MTKRSCVALIGIIPKIGFWLPASAIIVLLSACDEQAAATSVSQIPTSTTTLQTPTTIDPAPAMTAEAESLTNVLGQFPSASLITIQDDWLGYSPVSPQKALYSLARSTGSYSGTAQFLVGSYSGPQSYQSATAAITIPLGVAQDFLTRLAEAPLEPGEYTPKIGHTDDYPSLSIELQLINQTVRFYSQSQGTNHSPWGADISGKKYTINSGQPAQALETLAPYLKHEMLDNLADKVLKDLWRPTATP